MIDVAIVISFMAFVVAIGIIKGRSANTAQSFALGPQSYAPIVLIIITFSTMVDGSDTLGIAGDIFSTGLLFGALCMAPIISLLFVAFFMAQKMSPFVGMISSGDIMGKLYGRNAKIVTGNCVIIEGLVLAAGQIKAIGYLLSHSFGLNQHWGVILGGLVILSYMARGGMMSLGITDLVQFGALLIAIPMICGVAVVSFGGLGAIFEKIPSSHLTLFPSDEKFWAHVGLFIAIALPAIDPGSMQRILMARTAKQIKNTFFVTANFCVALYVVVAVIGFAALAQNPGGDPELAMPWIIDNVLPTGPRGLAIVGLLAIITTTVGSHLNMIAVAFSNDLVSPLRGQKLNDRQFISISKYAAVIGGIISILLATLFDGILETVFFVLLWGNPLFFPGLFWGIMGLNASSRAFWIGMVSAGATTLAYWCFASPDFFSSLASCAVNSAVLIISATKGKKLLPTMSFSRETVLGIANNLSIDKFKFRRYKSIFLWFIIIQASLPFFFWSSVNTTMCVYFSILYGTALVSFALLLSEAFKVGEKSQMVFWSANIFVFFATQTGMILAQCYYNPFWLLCAALSATMMVGLAHNRKAYLGLFLGGSLFLGFLFVKIGIVSPSNEMISWALALYICAPLICLLTMWQHDLKFAERVRNLNAAIPHMLGTPLASYEAKAKILENTGAPAVNAHDWAVANGYDGPRISKVEGKALRTAGSEMKQITKELRENARLSYADTPAFGDEKDSVCSVRACLNDTIEHFFAIDPSRRALFKLEPQGDIEFLGNREVFCYVLQDLFKNAFEEIALAKRGEIQVRIIEEARVLIIEDTAKGMTSKNLRQVFKKCFTTKADGHGLGLYFCKSKMENLGGDIECGAKEGEFTRFTLSFPYFDKSAQGLHNV